jgi:hypothetical protein
MVPAIERSAEMKVICLFAAMLPAIALSQGQQASAGLNLNKERIVVKLLSPISTKTSKAGDMFTAQVEEPANYAGAIMEGKILKVVAPKRGVGKEKSSLLFEWDTITVNQNTAAVLADLKEVSNSKGVKSVDEEGRAVGATSNKKRIAAAIGGTVLGGVLGGLAGGAKGAAAGSAAGLAAGLAIGLTMTSTSGNIEFLPGSHFTLEVSDRKARPE